MTVHFNEAAADAAAAAKEKVVTIDMKHKHESEILSQLMELTKGEPITATAEEVEMLQTLEAAQKKSEEDRLRNEAFKAAQKRKEAIMAQARAGTA